jgi:hypothetical protein
MRNAFVAHKKEEENVKKRIGQGIFNTCSKPIRTSSERIFNENGGILEAKSGNY